MKNIFLFYLAMLCAVIPANASNEIFQNIRGQVVDKLTQTPLPIANVFIPGTDPAIGTVTDLEGYFLLQRVPVGRVTITAAYMGYNALTLSNIIINSGKELILKFELEEMVIRGEEVTIKADKANKSGSGNSMAAVSSRYFTIEDEILAAKRLKDLLLSIEPEIEILDILDTVRNSISWLKSRKADLIFLDIHLSDGISFDIFKNPEIKFINPVSFNSAEAQCLKEIPFSVMRVVPCNLKTAIISSNDLIVFYIFKIKM